MSPLSAAAPQLLVIRLATASPSSGGHGEWSRRDASDIDGLSREAETSGSEKVNPSFRLRQGYDVTSRRIGYSRWALAFTFDGNGVKLSATTD